MAVETDSTAQLQLQAFDAGAHPWSYGISLARLVTSNSGILLGNDKNHELSSWSPVPYNIAISCITYISYIAKSNINYNLSLENCNLQFAT